MAYGIYFKTFCQFLAIVIILSLKCDYNYRLLIVEVCTLKLSKCFKVFLRMSFKNLNKNEYQAISQIDSRIQYILPTVFLFIFS